MQSEEFQNLIALYALDLLDESDRFVVEKALASSPELQAQLAEFQATIGSIAYSAPPVSMAANLKDSLFERINSQKQQSTIPSLETLKKEAAKASWQPFTAVPGVAVSKFYTDDEKQKVGYFVRSEAGVKFPSHQHLGEEEMLVLEGDLVIDGKMYSVGDRIYSAPSSVHQPSTLSGCTLFMYSSFEDAIINS